jgi:hypothetical protein
MIILTLKITPISPLYVFRSVQSKGDGLALSGRTFHTQADAFGPNANLNNGVVRRSTTFQRQRPSSAGPLSTAAAAAAAAAARSRCVEGKVGRGEVVEKKKRGNKKKKKNLDTSKQF